MTSPTWWEERPERLEYELERLRFLGLDPKIDEEAREAGQIIVRFDFTVEGRTVEFTAVFPHAYPWFSFELFAADLGLGHHQNPFAGNLCLLARPGHDWRPSDYVAKFLQEQLPAVVAAGLAMDSSTVASVEAHQAEPLSTYYDYFPGAVVLIDSAWTIPAGDAGSLQLGVEGVEPLRGAVVQVRGKTTLAADPAFRDRFPTSLAGRWFRVHEPILEQHAEGFLARLRAVAPEAGQPRWVTVGRTEVDVVAVIYPEEIAWRTPGDGWVFLVRTRPVGSGQAIRRAGDRSTRTPGSTVSLAQAGRYGESDMLARIPLLAPLRDRMVSVIGLGGLGAPSSMEFARAGLGTLGILDGDVSEPGNGARWPLGLSAAGWPKAREVHNVIRRDWPHTNVRGAHWRIGAAGIGENREAEALSLALDGTDLLYDASATLVVQNYLANLARERGLPYLAIWSTHGGWGGVVARIGPQSDACWHCLQLLLNDRSIPHPPVDPAPEIQPAGCGSPTFTGTSFDLAPVWTTGVRLAISTLTADTYGSFDWDVAVVSLRNQEGQPIVPTWTTHRLERHPQCANHA